VIVVCLKADLETYLDRNRRRESPSDEVAVHIVRREFERPDADVTVDVTARSSGAVVDCIVPVLRVLTEDRRPSEVGSDSGTR